MVVRGDRLPHLSAGEGEHRRMEERAVVPEVLRTEELRTSGGAVASRAFQAGLRHEHVRMGREELPLLREYLPILDEGETLGERARVPREQSFLDDPPLINQERAEPCRDEKHPPREPRESLKAFRAAT